MTDEPYEVECGCPAVCVIFHEDGPIELLSSIPKEDGRNIPNLLRQMADQLELQQQALNCGGRLN